MLDTARALFAARGYAAVTMDEVAAAVGVTKPLLYNYFGNKEQLFLACMKPAADALIGPRRVRGAARRDAPERAARRHPRVLRLPRRRQATRGGCCTTTRCPPAARSRCASVSTATRMEAMVTAALASRTESRAVEPLSVAIFGAAEALGRWWLRTGAMSARAHRRAVDSHDRTRTEEDADDDEPRSRSSAATGSRSRARTAPTRTLPTRTCSPRRSTGSSSASGSRASGSDEVVAGAVLKHSRDRDLTREAVLGSKLAPNTPAYDIQRACGTGLETVISVANKIALGQIDVGHRRRRRHRVRRADRRQRGPARTSCWTSTARSRCPAGRGR